MALWSRLYSDRKHTNDSYNIDTYRSSLLTVMHLSIVCPTTPCVGRGGGKWGDLLDLTLKTRPRGGVIDTPFVSTEPSIWHAF